MAGLDAADDRPATGDPPDVLHRHLKSPHGPGDPCLKVVAWVEAIEGFGWGMGG